MQLLLSEMKSEFTVRNFSCCIFPSDGVGLELFLVVLFYRRLIPQILSLLPDRVIFQKICWST